MYFNLSTHPQNTEAAAQDTNAVSPSSSPSASSTSSPLSSSSSLSSSSPATSNHKRIILPLDRSSSTNEAIDGTSGVLEKSITAVASPTSPQGPARLRPFSSTSLSPSASLPTDRLSSSAGVGSCCLQPPVTDTVQLESLEQRLPQSVGDATIHPVQLKSSASVTATTTLAAIAVASTMTMNCSRNDNDTENGINVSAMNTSCDVTHENGCIIPESTARTATTTTPITISSRMPSNLIDSHDCDGDDGSPPPNGDDVTFYRRGGVESTPPTTSSNGNRNNSRVQGEHHQDSGDEQRELASPRCQSRDSTGSTGGGRCQSDDSNCSGNGSNAAPTPTPNSPPVGLPLPATLPPSAAAALLPPQSAAMAAYLNAAAAAAAQQNRLLLGNPMASLAAQSPSPRQTTMQSPAGDDSPALDFSTKRSRRDSDGDSCKDDSDAVNLCNKSDGGTESPSSLGEVNSPLDLSVGGRKRSTDDEVPLARKLQRPNDYKPLPTSWVPPINPYLAAVAAASMSPKGGLPLEWNGKSKIATNDATKALEKMSEMTRLGGSDVGEMRSPAQPTGGGTGRHSAWQSHWLNKGADAVKDVFKCVWCKQSFPTLATLTTHMKETQHCGVNVPPSQQNHHEQQHHRHPVSSSAQSNVTSSSSSSSKSDLNLLIKETMPLPRKLVRGQDVWLGKGAEQTRQILKCMWCGQSFRSLAEMTNHMQQTQHYTNIISQEQIISWKSSDEKGSSSSSGGSAAAGVGPAPPMGGPAPQGPPGPQSATNSTVSAVLTCKVCDQAFSSLKDLSNHMIKNAHYKEHIMRSITETGGRRRQTREKRKKSLPVRKLLELERAAGQQDYKNGDPFKQQMNVSTKITCEKCGDKIETALFVDHIRQCVGGAIANASPRSIKNNILPPDGSLTSPPNSVGSRDGLKSISPASTSSTHRHISPHMPSPTPKDPNQGEKTSSSPSVLNAIEQLIEKSFDTRSRHGATAYAGNNSGTPLGASILKRLGIDESVDYTKPLIDAQTMGLLRSYHQHHQSQYGRRERSGSESSSVSDRGSSRMESLTPERKPEISTPLPPSTPRQTPDKIAQSPNCDEVKVKHEPTDEDADEEPERHSKISVKKEFNIEPSAEGTGELDLRKNRTPSSSAAPSPAPSPASSDRSSAGCGDKKLPGSSLTALSSMFDSLNSHNATSSTNDTSSGGRKPSAANPLAALQKLCEKTDNPPAANTRLTSSTNHPHHNPNGGLTGAGTPSGMVAFSWACNDAIITSDSVIKCAFCDTPFCSKGAYRHHLSKVHFVKDDASMEPLLQSSKPLMSGSSSSSTSSQPPPSPKAKSPASAPPPPPPTAQSPATSTADESVQSKFLKYTELAKQLSSKYV